MSILITSSLFSKKFKTGESQLDIYNHILVQTGTTVSQAMPRALSVFVIADINECRRYPGRLCAHKCENTPGSYYCTCTMGFKLSADGRSCEGMAVNALFMECEKQLVVLSAVCYFSLHEKSSQTSLLITGMLLLHVEDTIAHSLNISPLDWII